MEQPQFRFFSLIIMITLPGFREFLVLWQKNSKIMENQFHFSIDYYDHFAWLQLVWSSV